MTCSRDCSLPSACQAGDRAIERDRESGRKSETAKQKQKKKYPKISIISQANNTNCECEICWMLHVPCVPCVGVWAICQFDDCRQSAPRIDKYLGPSVRLVAAVRICHNFVI